MRVDVNVIDDVSYRFDLPNLKLARKFAVDTRLFGFVVKRDNFEMHVPAHRVKSVTVFLKDPDTL